MIALEDAALVARQYIERNLEHSGLRLVLQDEHTTEYSFGWLFFYNSEEFVRTGDVNHLLAGNAPLLVERETGRLFVTGTAYPVQVYIDRYLETGDPHGAISRRVLINGMRTVPSKLATIQAIRELTALAMTETKSLVDRLVGSEALSVEAPDAEAAGQLISRLEVLGWSAKRHYERGPGNSSEGG